MENNQSTNPISKNNVDSLGEASLSVKQPKSGKKLKKSLVIGVVAAVVVVLAVGGVLAYRLWYQNPEKVVLDAVTNAIKAKAVKSTGEFDLKIPSSDSLVGIESVKLVLSEKSDAAAFDINAKFTVKLYQYDKALTLEGAAILADNGDIYFKMVGLKKTVESYLDNLKVEAGQTVSVSAVLSIFDPIVKKVDGQWWRISAKELSETSETYAKQQKCLTKVANRLETEDSMRQELVGLYSKNRVITIKDELGVKDGSYGFKVGGDAKAAVGFMKGLRDTQVYKALHKCNDQFTISDSSLDVDKFDDGISDEATVNVELWVSQFGHEITKIKAGVSGKDIELTASLKPIFNESSEIKAPKGSKPIKELIEEVQKLMGGDVAEEVSSDVTDLGDLQRDQRDTQRKNDVNIVSAALTSYQANNRGKLPDPIAIDVADLKSTVYGFSSYVSDISSEITKVVIVDGQSVDTATGAGATTSKIVAATGARCDTDSQNGKYVKSTSTRESAIIVKLEAGSYYCLSA